MVIPTEERLAKLVGRVLHRAARASDAIADAHVVAVCAAAEVALVVTSHPGDISELAAGVPGTRIVTRRPEAIAAS